MKIRIIVLAASVLTGCTGPTWPSDQIPAGMEIERSLFAGGGFGLRESCDALVVELSDASATRLITGKRTKSGIELTPPGGGWSITPIPQASGNAAYEAAFAGCESGDRPLGDLPGALKRPGAFYKILNHGEAILIVAPRAKLAGYFNFG
ncbi:hypothetical protein RZN05_13650 [Sphingomonas sp. HF-S4]|uniref:Lipoprotein n=1 Tax=Sphingomonas agrestis TaxID=3080540 RepID=A0ABU3Y9E1_9SPHN|nr:hypothetical protein [Sphingomonas sp. HF-S4]MDV3458035.1 hypothetical protein [Sphingomonas sp. HF-S4]